MALKSIKPLEKYKFSDGPQKLSAKHILRRNRDVSLDDVPHLLPAFAITAALAPDVYEEYRGKPGGPYTLLLDENMSHYLIPLIHETLGRCSHINLVGLGKKSDRKVYGYAMSKGTDAIITFDMARKNSEDISNICEEEHRTRLRKGLDNTKLPLLIQFSKNMPLDKVADLIEKHTEEIKAHLEDRFCSSIELTPTKVIPGKNFVELLSGDSREASYVRTRVDIWAEEWQKRGKGQGNTEEIAEMARICAIECFKMRQRYDERTFTPAA